MAKAIACTGGRSSTHFRATEYSFQCCPATSLAVKVSLHSFSGRESPDSNPSQRRLRSRRVQAVIDVPAGRGSSSRSGNEDALARLGKDWQSSLILASSPGDPNYVSAERRIFDAVVASSAETHRRFQASKSLISADEDDDEAAMPPALADAYHRCGEVCAEYAKTFYLGTKLMTPERQRAIWAIYVWCRRTDELVDGPNAAHITPRALDRWEERLDDVFSGEPYDMLDAALAHTIEQYPMSIQPFRDMIDGMRMDLRKSRYNTFDELYVYCYNVAGTVGLMSVPVMGIDPKSQASVESVYSAALALGIANQLTNILRDVGEDAGRGRVYLPQDELAAFGLSDEDIFAGRVTNKWRDFMKFQIKRARQYFHRAECGVPELDAKSRWPVWASLSLYRQILDAIEANDYNNFSRRAYVDKWKKLLSLPGSYLVAQRGPAGTAQPQKAGMV